MNLHGKWDPQRFSTWDALFPDRFSSFAGTTLHVASIYDDMPILFMAEG